MEVNEADVQKYMTMYPKMDRLMVETLLKMTDEQHIAFQEQLQAKEYAEPPTPEELIVKDGIKIVNPQE
tara:strand:- start:191 stop:397 length:207 start_codon:yes stop_codon:yes gene_type:complete